MWSYAHLPWQIWTYAEVLSGTDSQSGVFIGEHAKLLHMLET